MIQDMRHYSFGKEGVQASLDLNPCEPGVELLRDVQSILGANADSEDVYLRFAAFGVRDYLGISYGKVGAAISG